MKAEISTEKPSDRETDYRIILKRSFEVRCRRNAKYSLRAFARDLKLSPASLSEVLKGRQGLSPLAARRIVIALELPDETAALFKAMVNARHSRSEVQKQLAISQLKKLNQKANIFVLKEDMYALVADWYHFALLELLRYTKKAPDPIWLAKRLEISRSEVEQALDRLRRLELISIDNGNVTVLKGTVSSPEDIPSEAIRESHKQVIQKALNSVENQSVDQRDLSAVMFAIDPKKIPEAKKSLTAFYEKFLRTFEHPEDNAEIYCLSMQLFALTKPHRTV